MKGVRGKKGHGRKNGEKEGKEGEPLCQILISGYASILHKYFGATTTSITTMQTEFWPIFGQIPQILMPWKRELAVVN